MLCYHAICIFLVQKFSSRDASCLFLKKPTIHANPPSKSTSPFQIKPALKISFISAIRKQTNNAAIRSKQIKKEANKQRYSMKKKKKKKKKKKSAPSLMRSLLAPPVTQHA